MKIPLHKMISIPLPILISLSLIIILSFSFIIYKSELPMFGYDSFNECRLREAQKSSKVSRAIIQRYCRELLGLKETPKIVKKPSNDSFTNPFANLLPEKNEGSSKPIQDQILTISLIVGLLAFVAFFINRFKQTKGIKPEEGVPVNPQNSVDGEGENKGASVWLKILATITAVFIVVLLSAIIAELVLGRVPTGTSNLLVLMELSVLIGIWHKTSASNSKRFIGIIAGIIGGTSLWYLMQVFMYSEVAALPYIFLASSYAVAFYVPKYVCGR